MTPGVKKSTPPPQKKKKKKKKKKPGAVGAARETKLPLIL